MKIIIYFSSYRYIFYQYYCNGVTKRQNAFCRGFCVPVTQLPNTHGMTHTVNTHGMTHIKLIPSLPNQLTEIQLRVDKCQRHHQLLFYVECAFHLTCTVVWDINIYCYALCYEPRIDQTYWTTLLLLYLNGVIQWFIACGDCHYQESNPLNIFQVHEWPASCTVCSNHGYRTSVYSQW